MANDPDTAQVGEDPAIESLEERIAAARKVEDARIARDRAPMGDGRSMGFQIASTMVGYPLGGILIGYGIDELLGTRPWIMLVLMFLAFLGACLRVIRDYQKQAG